MTQGRWDERIRRAEKLSVTYPFASEILRFYQHIARLQKDLYAHIQSASGNERIERQNGSLRNEFDLMMLLPRFRGFLTAIERNAPAPLAESAHQLAERGSEEWVNLLTTWWAQPEFEATTPEDAARFCARAFLEPYAEFLAAHSQFPAPEMTPSVCPVCGGRPQAGVLRPEGDGGKRSLICSLCATEWNFGRILCPHCQEGSELNLAVYVSEDFPHVRVEACDTCHTYLKTVDLTKNGLAVPIVDEIAAIPLDLWARENGYRKLQMNLVGM
jgi:FdhE protein